MPAQSNLFSAQGWIVGFGDPWRDERDVITPSTLRVDNILGSWIRGNIYTRRDGVRVYGYIYDAGSDGGAGMNRFAEIVLGGR